MFNTTEKFKFKKACFELFGIYDDEVVQTLRSSKTVELTPKEIIFHHLKKRIPYQTKEDLKSCQYFKKLTPYERNEILNLFDEIRKGSYVEPQRIVSKEDIFNCGLPLHLVTQEEKKALFKESYSLITAGRIIVAFVSLLILGLIACVVNFLEETDLYAVPCYAYSAGRSFWYRLGGNRTLYQYETNYLIRPMTYGILINQLVPITGSWYLDKGEKQNLLIFKYDNEVFMTTAGYLRLGFDFFK